MVGVELVQIHRRLTRQYAVLLGFQPTIIYESVDGLMYAECKPGNTDSRLFPSHVDAQPHRNLDSLL